MPTLSPVLEHTHETLFSNDHFSVMRYPGATKTLISFSSMGGARFEFYHILQNLPCNLIFVRDPDRRFYLDGVKGIGGNLFDFRDKLAYWTKELNSSYIGTLGNSMGAFAAILYGSMIGAKQVIAFGAQTFIDDATRTLYKDPRFAGQIANISTIRNRNLRNYFKAKEAKRPNITLIVGLEEFHDLIHASYLYEALSEHINVIALPKVDHMAAQAVKESGQLSQLVSNLFECSFEYLNLIEQNRVTDDKQVQVFSDLAQVVQPQSGQNRRDLIASQKTFWTHAITAYEDWQLAYYQLGDACKASGHLADAMGHYKRACALDHEEKRTVLAKQSYVYCALELGLTAEGEPVAKELLRTYPMEPRVFTTVSYLVHLYCLDERIDEAHQLLLEAKPAMGKDLRYMFACFRYYLTTHQTTLAAQCLDRARELSPTHSLIVRYQAELDQHKAPLGNWLTKIFQKKDTLLEGIL